jgi:hypothetical protein
MVVVESKSPVFVHASATFLFTRPPVPKYEKACSRTPRALDAGSLGYFTHRAYCRKCRQDVRRPIVHRGLLYAGVDTRRTEEDCFLTIAHRPYRLNPRSNPPRKVYQTSSHQEKKRTSSMRLHVNQMFSSPAPCNIWIPGFQGKFTWNKLREKNRRLKKTRLVHMTDTQSYS